MRILRRGAEGEEVRRWQHFLLGRRLLKGEVDARFGPKTEAATSAFQREQKLIADGVVGPLAYAAALRAGFDPGFSDPLGGDAGLEWPPPPSFVPLVSNRDREEIFGAFRYERTGSSGAIRILGDWEGGNIVRVEVPQLAGVPGAPRGGRIRVHRLVAEQCRAIFRSWEEAGLMPPVLSWGGSFAPRFVRGSRTVLSNHAWGTAFDINAAWNPLGAVPPPRGQVGSVRELVPLAHECGFYWGGHFSRRDGMHFEVARVGVEP